MVWKIIFIHFYDFLNIWIVIAINREKSVEQTARWYRSEYFITKFFSSPADGKYFVQGISATCLREKSRCRREQQEHFVQRVRPASKKSTN